MNELSRQEKLEVLIQKATYGGLTAPDWVQGPAHYAQGLLHQGAEYGVVFSHEFAKCLFGTDEVDEFGQSMKYIKLWAKQVAVVHLGKKYAVENANLHLLAVAGDAMRDSKTQMAIPEPQITEYKLQDALASIPFETHQLHDIDVITGTQAWQYHLQQAVLADDPIDYLYEAVTREGGKS